MWQAMHRTQCDCQALRFKDLRTMLLPFPTQFFYSSSPYPLILVHTPLYLKKNTVHHGQIEMNRLKGDVSSKRNHWSQQSPQPRSRHVSLVIQASAQQHHSLASRDKILRKRIIRNLLRQARCHVQDELARRCCVEWRRRVCRNYRVCR
jgi:hypothetical protein